MKLQLRAQKKRVWGNFAALALVQVSNYILPLITLPYLAKVIGAEGVGLVALSMALVLYFSTIVDYGFDYTGVRELAVIQSDKEGLARLFCEVLCCKLLLLTISFFLFCIVVVFVPSFREYYLFFFFAFLAVPARMFIHEWYFQGVERMKLIAVFSFITKSLYAGSIFVFVKQSEDLYLVPLLNSLSYVSVALIATGLVVKASAFNQIQNVKMKSVISRLKAGFDMFLSQIIPNLYNSFSVILLSLVAPLAVVGHLDIAKKVISVFEQFGNMLSRAFFPFLSRNVEYHSKYMWVGLSYGVAVIGLVWLMAEPVIMGFFGKEYESSVAYAKALAFGALFLMVYRVFGTNLLALLGKDRFVRNITLISAAAGFVSAIYLVPTYHAYGAIAVVIFARFLMASLSMYFGVKFKYEIKN